LANGHDALLSAFLASALFFSRTPFALAAKKRARWRYRMAETQWALRAAVFLIGAVFVLRAGRAGSAASL
jgi:hypothetical protein